MARSLQRRLDMDTQDTMDTQDKIVRVRLSLDHDYQFVATFPDTAAVPLVVDETPPVGAGHGPNPAALLATAIGNCLAASLLFCLRKAHIPVEALSVGAEASLARNSAGRYRIAGVTVQIEPQVAGIDLARLERCQHLFEDFCIVTESVRHGIDVQISVTPRAAELPTAV
jgi:organic hydroperoxide reductase OsmC/OhrA